MEEILKTIIDIIESLFGLYVAWWCYSYYTGRVNFAGGKEKTRQKRVKKYGWILILIIIVSLFFSLGLLINTLTSS